MKSKTKLYSEFVVSLNPKNKRKKIPSDWKKTFLKSEGVELVAEENDGSIRIKMEIDKGIDHNMGDIFKIEPYYKYKKEKYETQN